jgi:hypothetical protein
MCWNAIVERSHDVMSPGVNVPGRWPSILGENERRCQESVEFKRTVLFRASPFHRLALLLSCPFVYISS